MTTFEITVIVLLTAIVMLLIIAFIGGMATINARMKEGFQYLGKKIEGCDGKLDYIKSIAINIQSNTGDTVAWQKANNEMLQEAHKRLCEQNKLLADKDNILDDLRDIRPAQELGKASPNVPVPLPCYSPSGICTNPQMDCINCPKRDTGGTWSTSTNLNKED